jgi:UDP-2,4-diacetamido-2,4,6-trideoxy-beta-L-altropyranose hydrolase
MDAAVTDRWLFIPAAGPRAGLGHLRRCAALESIAPAAIAHAEASLLPADERHRQWSTIIPEQQVSWIILDGYMFTPEDHRAIQATGRQLLVIDDLHHLDEYHADLIVNPNAGSESIIYRGSSVGRRALGAEYAIISPEVLKLQKTFHDAPKVATRVIVTTGGGNPAGVRELIVAAIEAVDRQKRDLTLDITVVVGPLDNAADEVIPAGSRHRWTIARNPTNLAELMNSAELAISTAGVTMAELACLGVPTIAVIAVDNQEPGGTAFGKAGAVELAGNVEKITADSLTKIIERLVSDKSRRQTLTANAQRLIDGDGVKRIARAIRDLTIHLRPATIDDLQTLYTWANDPAARLASFRSEAISLDEHTRWLNDRLADAASTIYMASNSEQQPLGVARFQREANEAIISVNVSADHRGRQRGTRLIHLACRRYFFEHDVEAIIAQIKPNNEASYQAFRTAGFEFTGETQIHGQSANVFRLERDAWL